MSGFRHVLIALDHRTSPLFAVLDGAQFDHLPKSLSVAQLGARPLYSNIGMSDSDIVVTAPHMVALADGLDSTYAEKVDTVLDLVGDKPAAVFWQCPDGAEALYRHLRSINKVMVPHEEPLGRATKPREADDDDTHIMVLFRHADANVLAQTLGEMTTDEFVRFMGPASAVYFKPEPEWAGGNGSMRALRLEEPPPPRSGPLRLSRETMDRIGDVRLGRSRRRIVAYLRKTAPAQTNLVDDRQLDVATAAYMKEARCYGVTSEAAIGRWCYLQVITNGEMGRQKGVVDFVTKRNLGNNPGASSDERIDLLMRMASAQTRRMER